MIGGLRCCAWMLPVTVLIGPHLAVAQPTVLTLDQAVARAMAAAPAMAGAAADLDGARARERAAMTGWLPSLSGSAAYNRQTGNFAPRPGLSASNLGGGGGGFRYESTHKSYDYFNFSLTMSQTIWDHGRTLGAHRAAIAGVGAAEGDARVTRLDVWERVVSRYYGVLASRQMLQVAQRAADQARRHADRARALVEAGLRPRIDAVRAEADAQNAEAARLSAADALAVSRVALAIAIGDPGLSSVDVVDPGPLAEDDAGPFDAAEGVRQAVGQRPERAALAARIVAQEGVIRSVRARWLPVVAANASFNDSGLEVHELVWNWSVGVSVTVPVLSAVQTTYEYREAKARLARLHADQASLDLALRLEVEQAAAAVNEANVRMAPILAALDAAREALELAQGRYEAGTGDSVELLDAQAALANAEAGEVRARLDVALARVAWNRAVGRIPARLSGEGAP